MPPKCGVRVGAGTYRYKVEQLELVLERKKKHLQRLQKINQVLAHREQVGPRASFVFQCIHV